MGCPHCTETSMSPINIALGVFILVIVTHFIAKWYLLPWVRSKRPRGDSAKVVSDD